MTLSVMPHILGTCARRGAGWPGTGEGWGNNVDMVRLLACAPIMPALTPDPVATTGTGSGTAGGGTRIDALAMDRRDRTRSSGYVVVTEVIPAKAPASRRVGVSSGSVPLDVNS